MLELVSLLNSHFNIFQHLISMNSHLNQRCYLVGLNFIVFSLIKKDKTKKDKTNMVGCLSSSITNNIRVLAFMIVKETKYVEN